jgi:hypothetical protein
MEALTGTVVRSEAERVVLNFMRLGPEVSERVPLFTFQFSSAVAVK